VCSSAGTSASTVVGFTDRTSVLSTICAPVVVTIRWPEAFSTSCQAW
jgi:hypothetical protein